MDKLIQWLKEYDVMIHAMGSPDLKSQNIKTYSRLSGSEVKELMRKVDICVSAGGQTTYELMAVGTPFIPIGCAENQRMNMNAIQQAGLISEVLWSDQPNLIDRLANVWNSFEDKDKRIKNSLKSQTFIDGQGVFRIWDIIKELKFVST